MKSITFEKSAKDFQHIFAELKFRQSSIIVWQIDGGKRSILNAKLTSYHIDAGTLYFELTDKGILSSQLPMYCYAEDGQIIFKCKIVDTQFPKVSSAIPDEIRLLDEPDIGDFGKSIGISTVWKGRRFGVGYDMQTFDVIKSKSMAERSTRDRDFLNQEFMTVDEEDKKYASMRESPRARPKVEKYVKVKVKEIKDSIPFKLFDLSRGGLSFIVESEFLFEKGMKIMIIGFDDFSLDDPLFGEVMGIRPIDGDAKSFKVGIKFKDGQN